MTTLAEATSADSSGLPRLLSGMEWEVATERLSIGFNDLSRSKRAFLRAAWILRRQGILVQQFEAGREAAGSEYG